MTESGKKRKVSSDVDGTSTATTQGWGRGAVDGVAVVELKGLVQGADRRPIRGLKLFQIFREIGLIFIFFPGRLNFFFPEM